LQFVEGDMRFDRKEHNEGTCHVKDALDWKPAPSGVHRSPQSCCGCNRAFDATSLTQPLLNVGKPEKIPTAGRNCHGLWKVLESTPPITDCWSTNPSDVGYFASRNEVLLPSG
jgi:hypothetical protein